MDLFDIKMETSFSCAQCLFCLKFCPKVEHAEEKVFEREKSFKMLLRYLNIEIPNVSEFLNCGETGRVTFCDECDLLIVHFWEWYQNFEAVRLCLSNCLEEVGKVMRRKEDTRLRQNFENCGGVLGDLRSTIIYKCKNKLTSKPSVVLQKVAVLKVEEEVIPEELEVCPVSKPVFEQTPFELLTCTFCNMGFDSSSKLQRHSLQHHTFLLFSEQLPQGTTETQLEQAINSTMDMNLGGASSWGCISCHVPFCFRSELRTHILEFHQNQFISALGNAPRNEEECKGDATPLEKVLIDENMETGSGKEETIFQIVNCEGNLIPTFNKKPRVYKKRRKDLKPRIKSKQRTSFKPRAPYKLRKNSKLRNNLKPRTSLNSSYNLKPRTSLKPRATMKTSANMKSQTNLEPGTSLKPETNLNSKMTLKSRTNSNPQNKLKLDQTEVRPHQCSHCNLSFSKKAYLVTHCKAVHSAAYFKNLIPFDATEQELSKTVRKFSRFLTQKSRECILCQKMIWCGSHVKTHILTNHLPDVVKLLKEMKKI